MLKLTDHEKQEIVRFLEAGKELPEKYRFLLFEAKREGFRGQVDLLRNYLLQMLVLRQNCRRGLMPRFRGPKVL